MIELKKGPNEDLNKALNFVANKCGSVSVLVGVLNSSTTQIYRYLNAGSTSMSFAMKLSNMIRMCNTTEVLSEFGKKPTWRDFATLHSKKIDKSVSDFKRYK